MNYSKKTLLLICLYILPLVIFAQNIPFVIKGKTGAYNAPAKVYLFYPDGDKVDTAEIKNGVFLFKGNIPSPTRALLVLDREGNSPSKRGEDRAFLFLEKGTILVNSADSLKDAVIKGTPANVDAIQLKDEMMPVIQGLKGLDETFQAAPDSLKKSEAFIASLNEKWESLKNTHDSILYKFASTHTQTLAGLDALMQYDNDHPENKDSEKIFRKFSPEIQNTAMGKAFNRMLMAKKSGAIGSLATDFTQNDAAGQPVKLSDLRGKYVLLDFWASWCGPCRKENPTVVKAYQTFKNKGFTILGVSLDNKKDAWLNAIEQDGLEWINVSDLKGWTNEVAQLYGVRTIPQNLLIDPSGKIVDKNLRGEQLIQRLTEILGN